MNDIVNSPCPTMNRITPNIVEYQAGSSVIDPVDAAKVIASTNRTSPGPLISDSRRVSAGVAAAVLAADHVLSRNVSSSQTAK